MEREERVGERKGKLIQEKLTPLTGMSLISAIIIQELVKCQGSSVFPAPGQGQNTLGGWRLGGGEKGDRRREHSIPGKDAKRAGHSLDAAGGEILNNKLLTGTVPVNKKLLTGNLKKFQKVSPTPPQPPLVRPQKSPSVVQRLNGTLFPEGNQLSVNSPL